MSLVNEALKKARLEAARQDAARRGLPLPGVHRPDPRGLGTATLWKAGAVVLVAALAVLIFLAGRRSSTEPPASAEGVAAVQAPALPEIEPTAAPAQAEPEPPTAQPVERRATATRATPPPPAPEPEPVSQRAPQPAVVVADTGAPATQTGAGTVQPRIEPAPPPPPAPTAPAQADPTTTTAPPVRDLAAEPAATETSAAPLQTAVRKLELPGSRRIELGGIAWSEERPFALINGRVVGPGDEVESLTVVGIEQRHVELRGRDGHFLLRLK